MSDVQVLGSSTKLLQARGTSNFVLSAEAEEVCVLDTDRIYPLGPDGDCVFRRVYLPFSYDNAVSLTAEVAVDGRLVPEARTTLYRAGSGQDAVVCRLARRGTFIQVRLVVESPSAAWALELGANVALSPGMRARRNP